MPPGRTSRGQGGTGLRFLTQSSSMWWKRDNNKPDKDSRSSGGKNANGSSSSSSGNKSNNPPSSLSATGQGGGGGGPSPPPSPPPCIFPCVADNDPGIHYSTSWTLHPHPFFQTSHETDVVGSSLSFPFTGTGITVFGTIPPSNATHPPPTAAYRVDSDDPVLTTESLATDSVPNQPLFAKSNLSPGPHTLVIKVTGVQKESPYSIDFFIVTPVPVSHPSASSSPKALSPSSATPNPSSEAPSASSSVVAESAINNHSNSKSLSPPVGIIAGVLGAIIFLLVCVGAFFLVRARWRRRRRQRAAQYAQSSLFTTPESIMMYSRAPSSYYPFSQNPWRGKQPSISEKTERSLPSLPIGSYRSSQLPVPYGDDALHRQRDMHG